MIIFNETVKNITGHSPTLFRAPSGSYDNKTISAAEELGMMTIQWDAEPPATVKNGCI
ncbi:MAG: polysaccharide deacetylase family protein [Clostridia bacterium]|nr:polysaccharide deacetylase family protein [Clostridia bacterium]